MSPERDRRQERAPATPERAPAPAPETAAPAISPLGLLSGDRGPASVLALQRTAGNQAAMRAIGASASPTPPDGGDGDPPLASGDDDKPSAPDPPNWPPDPSHRAGPDRPRG